VAEVAALGVWHDQFGQAVVLVAVPAEASGTDELSLRAACQQSLPAYMVPKHIDLRTGSLPRNPNGKIDRKLLADEFRDLFAATAGQ
jgi:acyl-CoA synthetase (AMP-forming)/AMP-acid ligase II